MALHHAPLLHELYLRTPDYFALLGTRPPSLGEVERDVQTALFDPRRCLELIYQRAKMPGESVPEESVLGEPIGSLDYKLNFPEMDDVTINLLLIRGDLQSSGLGQQVVRMLEARLRATRTSAPAGQGPQTSDSPASDSPASDSPASDSKLPPVQNSRAQAPDLEPSRLQTGHATPRLLASVLGENPRAVAFWKRLGFSFATDARPVMTWYAKPLGSPAPARLAATS